MVCSPLQKHAKDQSAIYQSNSLKALHMTQQLGAPTLLLVHHSSFLSDRLFFDSLYQAAVCRSAPRSEIV